MKAECKYIRVSPYKLRPIADLVRGKSLAESLAYLQAHMTKRVKPLLKVLNSAYANAKDLHKDVDSPEMLTVKKIFVDQGPILRYYKPAAMGRAAVQRRRLSHVTVILEKIVDEKR